MLQPNSLSFAEFVRLLDEAYDEICIWDKEQRLIYMNKACYRHYGLFPEEMIGKTVEELTQKEELWWPTCVPETMEIREPVIQNQKTFFNTKMVTISVPILDANQNVEYVMQTVRDSSESLFQMLSAYGAVENISEPIHTKIIGKSPEIKEVKSQINKIARTKAPILILGETGTGKSLFAKYIHEKSERKNKPFVAINMASLSPTVIESELFGYQKGAFTGANKEGKKGIFELANGGTLFLDEIGELPYDLQAKFLHVIQEEEIIPVGAIVPIQLNIRVICATNCNMEEMIAAGKFREDLFHRLNTFQITIPPLRKRREDIPVLVAYYLERFNERYKKNASCSEEVLQAFLRYKWSGNVRELSNTIERGVIMADVGRIEIHNLQESFFNIANVREVCTGLQGVESFDTAVEAYEKRLILSAVQIYKTSRRVAEALQISQTKANRLIRKYVTTEEIIE
ncbi:sigma-54 interaction domain-containing protein [Chakrabartyella piscis]|uniref:sigma-54 interaction domain-containing protein n=1 Tax=Chakrabartyella piscis TaxID=2918914 RepID=UPI002958AD26|nr:sigma 54-interacting transcriptional regulator [Chakrabartyella piscis]